MTRIVAARVAAFTLDRLPTPALRETAGDRLMSRMYARAATIAAVCGALGAIHTPAAAHQEHHGVPGSSAQVASYAVGGAPREDAPDRTQGPGRIF